MTNKELIKLIDGGENLRVEFKQRFSEYDKIAKEIIAFANTKGGTIIFGVNDDKTLCGIHSEKSITELVNQTIEEYCTPKPKFSFNFFEINGYELVSVEVSESDNKPVRIQDYKKKLDLNTAQVYVRVNDKSVPASKEMIKLLQNQIEKSELKNYKIGKNERIAFELLERNETLTVKDLMEKANISKRRASRTLINMVRADILLIHTKDNGEDYFSYSG
ncbi:MAG: ATP-binding protein [Melioribacteraceae bacterium]|nr:ATP-binding protein [Melioribacteraceae bacterium]MCO6474180.1 ATP-binding protein [Melioribacteraceae bacterium]MDD3557381.1 putative DNA binding domain-containing protein [Melioribacteraceae bacterium]